MKTEKQIKDYKTYEIPLIIVYEIDMEQEILSKASNLLDSTLNDPELGLLLGGDYGDFYEFI